MSSAAGHNLSEDDLDSEGDSDKTPANAGQGCYRNYDHYAYTRNSAYNQVFRVKIEHNVKLKLSSFSKGKFQSLLSLLYVDQLLRISVVGTLNRMTTTKRKVIKIMRIQSTNVKILPILNLS